MTLGAALVLAGSRGGASDPLAVHAGVSHKAMIEVGGRPMLARVVGAVAAAGYARIAVSIERPELVEGLAAEALPAASGPSASVASAFEALGAPLLVTTADHALLRPEWIAHFVANAPAGADIVVGLARAADVTVAAPEGRRTFLRFTDGAYSGCNLFLLATPRAARVVALWREVEALRKRPLELLGRLGPLTAVQYALGLLSLPTALARLGRLAGVEAAAVILPFGEAAIDVDKPEDLALVRRMVAHENR